MGTNKAENPVSILFQGMNTVFKRQTAISTFDANWCQRRTDQSLKYLWPPLTNSRSFQNDIICLGPCVDRT